MIVLAVDGGNSKTDLALVGDDGALLAHARGPLSSPHHLGLDGCLDVLAAAASTRPASTAAAPTWRRCCSPASTSRTRRSALHDGARRSAAGRRRVTSATTPSPCCAPAPSAAGASRSPAAPGINCVGVAPDGRHVRFPGARRDHRRLGRRPRRRPRRRSRRRRAARTAAARRPRSSSSSRRTSATPRPLAARARDPRRRARRSGALLELAPVVLRSCRATRSRVEIGDRLADEVVALARAARRRGSGSATSRSRCSSAAG